MKKLFIIVMALVLAGALAYSQSNTTQSEQKTVTGKVMLVKLGDQTKKTKTEMSVQNSTDKKDINFVITEKTVLKNKLGKSIKISAIKKNGDVKVLYVVATDGSNEATEVDLLN